MPAPIPRPRARHHGLHFGALATGPHNAITDVPGVRVGQVTLWEDPDVRTGVTAIVPGSVTEVFERPVAASVASLNGAGELTGSHQMTEWGVIETPIVLTSTSAVGRAYDAVVDAVFEACSSAGVEDVVIPVVGECDDSWLDRADRRSVGVADVRRALEEANDGPVGEGVVGAGTGMITMGHKAGIGTSSRLVAGGTVGVLLLCNFGSPDQLRIPGRAVASVGDGPRRPAGSCVGIVATDLGLDRHQLRRVAMRVGLGLARVGSVAHHGSGELFCAFSTTTRLDRATGIVGTAAPVADRTLDDVFQAVVDASEEAVLNALCVADTVTGRDGHRVPGLVLD